MFAIFLSLLLQIPAYAFPGTKGFTECHFMWQERTTHPNLLLRDNGTVPPDVIRDGVINSFHGRIDDSIWRWNQQMEAVALRGRIVRVPTNYASGVDIIVGQENIGFSFGQTWWDGVPGCLVHSTVDNDTLLVDIRWDVRSDWFTQDNTRRTYWETQCPAGTGTAYTCGKSFDFGGLFHHELGHGLGLHHPEAVDSHHGAAVPGGPAYTEARCSVRDSKATMCAGALDKWRTGLRVEELWDRESFGQHVSVHSGH